MSPSESTLCRCIVLDGMEKNRDFDMNSQALMD